MSQAEELLNGMSEEIPVHTHPVPDADTYFVIDPVTRKIENTNPKKNVIMQYDHNSERFTFELPRYIDGHDMLECTSVTVNVDNIEVVESEGDQVVEPRVNPDAPDMTDLRLHPNDPEKVICSWLISRNSTQLAGILSFHIEFKCVDSNGNVVYEWSTDQYDEIAIKARKKNGEVAVVEHSDLLEQWRTRIFGAGDSVMASITAEGEAQVAAVKAESETQQEAVELKGAQTLDTIPEEYTEVDAMADEAVRSKGDAIVCEAEGELITLKDSSDDHIRGLKLLGKSTQFTTTGKNLLPYPYSYDTKSTNGVDIVVNTDGSILINGTATAGISFHLATTLTLPAGEYVLSGCPSGGGLEKYRIYFSDNVTKTVADYGSQSTFTLAEAFTGQVVIQIFSGVTLNSLMFYPMIRPASITDDVYEPYTGGKPSPNPEYPQEIVSVENPSIAVHSKNLIPFPYPMFANSNTDELDVAVLDDGGVHINGTPTQDSFINLCKYDFGPNHISASTASGFVVNKHNSGIWVAYDGKNKITFIMVKSGTVCNNEVVYPQLEAGTVATEYEKGSGRQSLAINGTLSGIPVTSGGNYTDSDGQQWICDEVDLERGVLVKRCDHCVFDGSDDEVWDYEVTKELFKLSYLNLNKEWNVVTNTGRSLMLHYGYDASIWNETVTEYGYCINFDSLFIRHKNIMSLDSFKEHIAASPIELTCVMSEPIEIPLSAEEIVAFKALCTNYPNTTILNDAGAWMSVKYNADTKTYVENPKTLKLVDSSTGVVYELKIVDGSLVVNPI